MTAIQPNSTIVIGRSALKYGGEDTYYWENATVQRNNIMYEEIRTWNECSYQRERRNYIRVSGNAEDFDGCNYLCFRNISYDHQATPKWYYAFVLNIDYINNETMEIHYEIDSIQTYFFDYHENSCFVERIHSLTDDIGDNIIPENVNCGEYVNISNNTIVSFEDKATIIVAPYQAIASTTLFDGATSGLKIFGFYNTTHTDVFGTTHVGELTSIHNCLQYYTTAGNPELTGAFTVPAYILDLYTRNTTDSTDYSNYLKITGYRFTNENKTIQTAPAISTTDSINGYTPKNKKLYTFPYNYCLIHDGNGNDIVIRYEFCRKQNNQLIPEIEIRSTVVNPAYIIVRPYDYKSVGYTFSPSQQITITGFPMVAYTYPVWQQWIARSLIPNLMRATATVVGGSLASTTLRPEPNFIGTINGINAFDISNRNAYDNKTKAFAQLGVSSTIGNIVAQGYTGSMESSYSKGNYTNNGSSLLTNNLGIYYSRTCVSRQYAKIIDDYFTLYGYATKTILANTSFRKRRTRFTYVKTVGASINGQIPGDAMIDICSRYDSGVRFWADYENMYNYTYDNTLL